jgi:hypothetical protein
MHRGCDQVFPSHRGFSPVSGHSNKAENRLNGFQSEANGTTPR